jgi:hypothetical protein
MVKVISLTNNQNLITQIEEVPSELGEPDCKLIKPFVIKEDRVLEPFLMDVTNETVFMMSSDKIITLAEPLPTLLEKYQSLTKE